MGIKSILSVLLFWNVSAETQKVKSLKTKIGRKDKFYRRVLDIEAELEKQLYSLRDAIRNSEEIIGEKLQYISEANDLLNYYEKKISDCATREKSCKENLDTLKKCKDEYIEKLRIIRVTGKEIYSECTKLKNEIDEKKKELLEYKKLKDEHAEISKKYAEALKYHNNLKLEISKFQEVEHANSEIEKKIKEIFELCRY